VFKTKKIQLVLALATIFAVAGCTRIATSTGGGGLFASNPPALEETITPAQNTQSAKQLTSLSSYISEAALSEMSANEKVEATSAQFYALQFGRPGAPRQWSGDEGALGRVTVGPFVRVNNLDCRDFVHKVTIGENDYSLSGTSCREADGSWTVVDNS